MKAQLPEASSQTQLRLSQNMLPVLARLFHSNIPESVAKCSFSLRFKYLKPGPSIIRFLSNALPMKIVGRQSSSPFCKVSCSTALIIEGTQKANTKGNMSLANEP